MTNQTPTPEQENPGKVALADLRTLCTGRDAANEIRMDRGTGLAILDFVSELEGLVVQSECLLDTLDKTEAARIRAFETLKARADAYALALEAIRRNAMPLYSCIEPGCAEEHSFPAEDLALCNEGPVCEECWAELSGEDDVAWQDLPPFIPPWAEDIAAEASRADAAEAENARLREALEKIAAHSDHWEEHSDMDSLAWLLGEASKARAVLSSQSFTGQNDGQPALPCTDAVRDVIAERERQKSVEGWTLEHDDTHANGELAQAASEYAHQHSGRGVNYPPGSPPKFTWPWAKSWWKPGTPRQNAVKAAALLIAEIERIDRATPTPPDGEQP